MKIFDKVKEIINELCGLEEINVEDSLQQDLGLDSMLLVSLIIEIEDKFQIVLDEADMNPFDLNTVKDVLCLVNKYCGGCYEEIC